MNECRHHGLEPVLHPVTYTVFWCGTPTCGRYAWPPGKGPELPCPDCRRELVSVASTTVVIGLCPGCWGGVPEEMLPSYVAVP